MNGEYETNKEIFVLKYSILQNLIDKYCLECTCEQESQLGEVLYSINQSLDQYNKDTNEYKINFYKNCLDYAKSFGKSDEDIIVAILGMIEDDIMPQYLNIEDATIRYEEFIEDISRDSASSMRL
jgi:hypothetical protein